MRRERLIRPTKTCKFNRLQRLCRPDKRSASGNFAFVISLERVSLLARFFYALLLLKCLMPNHQCNQADHHQTTQCAGQNKLPTHPLTAANKFIIVMIAINVGHRYTKRDAPVLLGWPCEVKKPLHQHIDRAMDRSYAVPLTTRVVMRNSAPC